MTRRIGPLVDLMRRGEERTLLWENGLVGPVSVPDDVLVEYELFVDSRGGYVLEYPIHRDDDDERRRCQ